jgi:hypothetical protein
VVFHSAGVAGLLNFQQRVFASRNSVHAKTHVDLLIGVFVANLICQNNDPSIIPSRL